MTEYNPTDTEVDLDFKTIQQVAACGYEPIERKGKGTYGFVYEVGDNLGNLFAFKYILPGEYYTKYGLDSLNEIDILTRVYHPYIIHASKIVTANDCNIDGMAVVLPLADRTFFDIIRDPVMTTENKLPMIYKLATALEFMHQSRILHLDIKSTNVVLQGNIPYLIDFGLSMVVDNVVTGKYNGSTRVTVDHRAPEILSGGRVYNAAVDIWAFGIMILYILGGRPIFDVNFQAITDMDFYHVVSAAFSDTREIIRLLRGVRPKYKDMCINLLSSILQLEPLKRPTASEICNHPIFDEFREKVDGILEVPVISYDYMDDHRDILKLIIHWANILYPGERAELLFLAVDLFNRLDSFYKNKDALNRMSVAATCLWVAAKLTNSKEISLDRLVSELIIMVPMITNKMILDDEVSIIYLLSGVLNVSSLYAACTNGDELKLSFEHIIISRDSTLYALTDISKWVDIMKATIINPIHLDKNITITQLQT